MKHVILLLSVVFANLLASSCSSGDCKLAFESASDIGTVYHEGSLLYNDDEDIYTLTAAGLNLWANEDAFYFVWKKVRGDFEISGDVAFEGEGVNPHRKIGFMIRENLDAGSRYADVAVHGDGLISLQYRPQTDGETLESKSAKTHSNSIALVKKGDKISIRTGQGEIPAVDDTSIEMSFPQEFYIGMFICSHEDDVLETGYVKNVKFKVSK